MPSKNYETVIALAEIVPNVAISRHTYPRLEGGYHFEELLSAWHEHFGN